MRRESPRTRFAQRVPRSTGRSGDSRPGPVERTGQVASKVTRFEVESIGAVARPKEFGAAQRDRPPGKSAPGRDQ